MNPVKKIIQQLFTLVTGILVLGYKVIKQVVLPLGGKKGNLLSSLFVFIVGVLEGLIQFERDLLKAPMLFRNKYIRQGLQVAAAIFLFIGSLEWSATAAPANSQSSLPSVQNITRAPAQESKEYHPAHRQTQGFVLPSFTRSSIVCVRIAPPNIKKYILVCCFRT